MWGKILRLTMLSACILSKTYSQTYPGYRTGNYNGVNSVFFNPSEIADNRFKWNVNLASVNGFVGTNQGGLKFSDITKSFNANDLRSRFLLGKTNINSLDYVDILGPSVMISLSPNTSVALTTHSRAFGNTRDVDGNLASAIIDPANSGLTAAVPLSGANSLVHATGWTDIGGSVAQVFTPKGSHSFFKGGITLKYILGTADTYMTTQLNGTVGPGSPAAVLTGPVSGNIYFNTAGTDFTDYKYKDFFKFNGHGLGGDIGFVYEYRPDLDYSIYTNDRWANKYKLKIGVSLMDVGTIHFNKPENQAANYTTHIPAGQNYSLSAFQGKSVSSFIPVFNASPQYFTPGEAQNSSYDVKLPTTIQANIDYLIGRNTNFAVNVAGQFNINNQKNFNLFYYNSVSVTPRWENPLVSVELPLTYNQLTQFNAGIALRVGPFFIGSGSVISTLFHESRQADLFVGLNWGVQFKKKIRPDTDKDGIYDDVDKCPTVFGYARYQGCPIPDTDGDGINDEQDSCKTVPGVAKYHGCPVPDTDKDGINDEEDSCVNTPGLPQFHGCPDTDGDGIPDPVDKCPTIAGVAKYQGCPIPDQDKDGVPDDVDLCPTIPGPPETHGCPITDVLLKITADFKNILFNTGKATLKPQSEAIISRAAVIMKEQIPNSSFYIDGYTDNTGSAAVNKRLSKTRAQAVANALIADGVNKSRLVARGFGKEYPKCSNTTAEGRQCNRRVEVVIRNVNQTEQKSSIRTE